MTELRFADYFAIARTPRYRALSRRRVRSAGRLGMLLIAGAAVLNGFWLTAARPDAAGIGLALNGSLVLLALGGYAAIGTFARRHTEVVIFVALVAVDGAIIGLGLTPAGLGSLTDGYALLLPPVVALVIPWQTNVHVAWLAVHAALIVGYALSGSGPGAGLLVLLLVASVASQAGHVADLRGQVRNFTMTERIRALNRQAKRDRARLDRLNTALGVAAETDQLTSLGNRLALIAALRVIRSRIERNGERYGLLIVDIDRFKAINDSMGHLHGDAVLRSTSHVLSGSLRLGDSAYRYGGEEFVVLMRVADDADALNAANRLRGAVQALQIPNAANKPYGVLTVSIGVAVVGTEWVTMDDEAWLGAADVALYQAKENGRNRCEISGVPSLLTPSAS